MMRESAGVCNDHGKCRITEAAGAVHESIHVIDRVTFIAA